MALRPDNTEKVNNVLEKEPNVTIFLRPIAAPAALGLAGFSGSTFITASYIAGWWGNKDSPTIFFPFVAFWGGLGQFIAGLYGFAARDVLVTVIHVLWGSFWMSIGLLYLLVVSPKPTCLWSNKKSTPHTNRHSYSDNGRITEPQHLRAFPRASLLVRRPLPLHLVKRKSPHPLPYSLRQPLTPGPNRQLHPPPATSSSAASSQLLPSAPLSPAASSPTAAASARG